MWEELGDHQLIPTLYDHRNEWCCEDIINSLKHFCIEHESVFSSVKAGRLCHCWQLFYLFIVKGAITNSLKNGFCGKVEGVDGRMCMVGYFPFS